MKGWGKLEGSLQNWKDCPSRSMGVCGAGGDDRGDRDDGGILNARLEIIFCPQRNWKMVTARYTHRKEPQVQKEERRVDGRSSLGSPARNPRVR